MGAVVSRPRLGRTGAVALSEESRRSELLPIAVLVLGSLVVAVLCALVGVRIEALAIDETIHKQQAVHYADGLIGALLHDPTARSTARLYSVFLAPIFAVFDGDVAVRIARGWSAFLFSSASVPAYLLARGLGVPRWRSVLAGLACVAVPWLSLTTVLFTENLAYPLFLWAVWAIIRSMRSPGWRNDLLALILVVAALCTRTQLFALLVGYVLLAAWRAWPMRRDAVRAFPFTFAAIALAVLGVLVLLAAGRIGSNFDSALGPYQGIIDRGAWPTDAGLAALLEFAAVVVGTGVVPAVIALAWLPRTLSRRDDPAWLAALVGLVLTATLWITALLAQGGWLGDRSEERYFFYAAPLIWIAAVAGLGDRAAVRPRALLGATAVCAIAVVAVPAAVPLTPEKGFLTPVTATIQKVVPDWVSGIEGLSPRDFLLVAILALGGLAALLWRRRPALIGIALGAAVAIQVALAVYVVWAVPTGRVDGVPARTGDDIAANGWVDHAADGRAVTLLGNQPAPGGDNQQREISFWNDAIKDTAIIPPTGLPGVAYPTFLLGTASTDVEADATLANPQAADGLVVQDPDSPFAQLDGRRVALAPPAGVSAGQEELIDAGAAPKVRWLVTGLQGDGWIAAGDAARLGAAGRGPTEVTFAFSSLVNAATRAQLELGGKKRTIVFPAGPPAPRKVTLTVCAPAGGTLKAAQTAPLDDGRQVAVHVDWVKVRPATTAVACAG